MRSHRHTIKRVYANHHFEISPVLSHRYIYRQHTRTSKMANSVFVNQRMFQFHMAMKNDIINKQLSIEFNLISSIGEFYRKTRNFRQSVFHFADFSLSISGLKWSVNQHNEKRKHIIQTLCVYQLEKIIF